MKSPEHLISAHFEEEPKKEERTEELTGEEMKERYDTRQEMLRKAPDLEGLLREEWKKERGTDAPEGINLSLRAVESFRRTVKEAQDLRKVVRYSKDEHERTTALSLYTQKTKEIEKYKDYGPSFEASYREYLHAQSEYFDFMRAMGDVHKLQALLEEPDFKSAKANAQLDKRASSRLGTIMHEVEAETDQDVKLSLEALATIYPKGSKEYELAAQELTEEKEDKPETKRDIEEQISKLKAEIQEKWENPMVRYFWQNRELDKMLDDFGEGKDVIETQSVIKSLNKLNEWEKEHQRTTIGGVLVGPPGVGKTTLVRHYLEEKDREYVYIDLSEEVTRFMLYGSKAIEFRSATDYYQQLAKEFSAMDEAGIRKFIEEHHEVVKNTFKVTDGEASAVLVNQILEELDKGKTETQDDPALAKQLGDLKEKILGLTNTAFRRELAGQFGHLASRNGWRDGVVISALRRGNNIIFDEFNKNKNWSLIYGLMTAKPGESWYFPDNDEEISIPDDWRMYFTANIGRRHGGFQVAEALASRANGKVMEVGYPPVREEMRVALASLSNAEGDFLRSKDDLAKLFVLINEVFPRVRKFTEDRPQTIPVSYRVLRDLGEKLILYRDQKSKELVYQPSNKSFDESLYEVMVESYHLYEDKTSPKEIVNIATSVGLLLDDSVKEKVIGWLGQETYDERKKTFTEHAEDFRQIVKKIQGLTRDVSQIAMPEAKQF